MWIAPDCPAASGLDVDSDGEGVRVSIILFIKAYLNIFAQQNFAINKHNTLTYIHADSQIMGPCILLTYLFTINNTITKLPINFKNTARNYSKQRTNCLLGTGKGSVGVSTEDVGKLKEFYNVKRN